MPDILIRGMEMPKKCGVCPCFTAEQGAETCNPLDRNVDGEGQPEPDCPLVELPEHGDLILKDDAIVAVKLLSDLYPEYRKILAVLWDQIKDLTVIIPESGEATNDPKT